jgi:mono/diheme cytochrome c family protein
MRKSLWMGGAIAILSVAAFLYGQGGAKPQPARPPAGTASPARPVTNEQRAFLDQYCVNCHNVDDDVAGLKLDTINLTRISENAETWEKVVRKLRTGMMPPVSSGSPKPPTTSTHAMISWLENELDRNAKPFLPPSSLHRVNRTEYANAVRDLLDLEIDPAQYLPSDDSSHGFDNMAGTLGVSSTLVEAYVTAAQKISRLAIGAAASSTQTLYRAPEDTSQRYHIEGLPFGTRGGMRIEHEFPSDGEYVITVNPILGDNMSPTPFGSVPCEKVEILLDGELLRQVDWAGTAGGGGRGGGGCGPSGAGGGGGRGGGANSGMTIRFKATAGLHVVGATFLETNLAPILDIDRHFMRDTIQTGPFPGYTFFPHVGSVQIEGPFNAAAAQDSASRRKVLVCRPTSPADETTCAKQIVSKLAGKAFRGTAVAADVDDIMTFYSFGRQRGDFDHGIEAALARVLASPKFIYRVETEPANIKAGETYRVSDIELASRLSFFLWSSGPDAELLDLATKGKLKEPAVLEAQTRRMLKDPRSEALSVNFAGQWLNLRGMESAGPLPMLYPDFDDPLRQAMRREVELFFDSIVREDHSIGDLMTADYTFVNERLAKHYGIPDIYGSSFRRVELGPAFDSRRGLLGKGAILTTTSKPERTSPVSRGKWIMTNMLGLSPPDPPPDVPALKAKADDPNATEPSMRKKMEEHRGRIDCAHCHTLMDPIGFSLENFDAIGKWRAKDGGQPVNAIDTAYDGTPLEGPAGLRGWLAGYSDQFGEVVAEKLLTYALGRGVEYPDMPLVRSIARETAKNDSHFSALVLAIVRSAPFQMSRK